jgi:manganese/zinc/iron transport system substrate-binding protein
MIVRALWRYGLLILALFCGAPGCSEQRMPEADRRLQLVVTVGMVADIVGQIGGANVAVQQIMGPGVDPHLYKATRDDVRAVMQADAVFYAGLMLEGKLINVLDKLGQRRSVVAVTSNVDKQFLLTPDDNAAHYDPHLWMDIAAWQQIIPPILTELCRLDPNNRAEYQRRATIYSESLQALHAYAIRQLGTIPPQRRVLITSHDAFNYFGRAYGLEVIGVQGLSTESEAGLQQINALVDLLVEKQITAVFIESSVPKKNIEALIDGAAARGHRVEIGGELYSDAMGPAGTHAGTYIGMMEHNINTVVRGLGGDVSSLGFQFNGIEPVVAGSASEQE